MNEDILSYILALLLFVSNAGWLLAWVYAETQHRRERAALYDRLMAKDLVEYKAAENPKAPKGRNFVKRGIEKSIQRATNDQ